MLIIYTDGSTLKNGSKDAVGGFGVVVCKGEPGQHPNDYEIIDAYAERAEGTTNNRMELSAILWAMENYGGRPGDFFPPLVYSDSMYCINSFTNWIKGWKANGWVRAKNKPLENKDLMQRYDQLTSNQGIKIDLKYIKGHAGEWGNELADQLATGKLTPEQVMNGEY